MVYFTTKENLHLKSLLLMLKIAYLLAVGIDRSAEVALLPTELQLEVVESYVGKEAVEMLKILVETLLEGHLDADGLEHLEVTVGNTGQVAVKIDGYTEVVRSGTAVESYIGMYLLLMVAEVVRCGCMEVGDTG